MANPSLDIRTLRQWNDRRWLYLVKREKQVVFRHCAFQRFFLQTDMVVGNFRVYPQLFLCHFEGRIIQKRLRPFLVRYN